MLSSDTIDRIHALNLDPFTETAVCEIVQDAVNAAAPNPANLLPSMIPADWPPDYQARFWAKYPNKTAKPRAMKALEKVAHSGKTRWNDLMAGLERYNISPKVRDGFVKNPATWINDEGWTDLPNFGPVTKSRNPGFFEMLANGE